MLFRLRESQSFCAAMSTFLLFSFAHKVYKKMRVSKRKRRWENAGVKQTPLRLTCWKLEVKVKRKRHDINIIREANTTYQEQGFFN